MDPTQRGEKRRGGEEEEEEDVNEETKRQRHVHKVQALGQEDATVKFLEGLVFGAEDELLDRLVEEKSSGGGGLLEEEGDSSGSEEEEEDEERPENRPARRRAAWHDEDDDQEEEVDMSHRFRRQLKKGEAESSMSTRKLQQRMQEQFQKSMGGAPSWAETKPKKKKKSKKTAEDDDDDEDDDEDGDDLLRKTGNFVASSESLPKGVIRMKKCVDANSAQRSEGRVTTVQFHPNAQVVMTAGLDQTISLFQVDGKTNPKIQSIHLERFPVHKARFSTDGERVVATSFRNRLFYVYDMMEGRVVPVPSIRGLKEQRVKEFEVSPDGDSLLLTGSSGYLHVLTMKTKEVVRSFKINGEVCGAAFSRDGSKVFVSSEEGEVCVFDSRSCRCVSRFQDDGCVRASSLASSPNGQYLACGSQSGVVNIYSQEACLIQATPPPLRAVMSLLTSATSLCFSPSSEVLAIASRACDEAARLVHLPSCSVFSNFPVFERRTVRRAHCLSFSPHGGFFSLGNDKGRAPLFRLLHYKDF